MVWHTTIDVAQCAERAEAFLRRDPVRNNVLLTTIAHARAGTGTWERGRELYAWNEAGGVVDGAATHTPPYGLLLPDLTGDAVESLVRLLHDDEHRALPGVTGPSRTAEAFAASWSARTGVAARVAMRERMYLLVDVIAPGRPVEGELRTTVEGDVPLIARWIEAFAAEAGTVPTDYVQWARTRLTSVRIWRRDDGVDVSLVASSPPVAGVARVGPVWTPPEHRRRGYATAAVAALSTALLDSSVSACMLYTDLANPTSNSIYQAVGYRPVGDVLRYAFG